MGVLRAGFHGTLGSSSSAQIIDGSLKFDNDKEQVLTRTPSSAGNRNSYTGSVWIKRTAFAPENNSNSNAENYTIFTAGTNSANNIDNIKFYKNAGTDDANKIEYASYIGSYQYLIYTNAKYRDPDGWYHVVWNYDGTTAKLYVNGEQITSFDTNTQNGGSSGHFNNTVQHVIGGNCDLANSSYFDGHMSQFYWIDGQTLDPSYFGFTDPLTNTWKPKKYTGDVNGSADTKSEDGSFSATGNQVGGPIANAYDGTIGEQDGSTSGITFWGRSGGTATQSGLSIPVTSSVKIRYNVNVGGGTITVNSVSKDANVPGGGNTSLETLEWDASSVGYSISSIAITSPNLGVGVYVSGIIVDGVVLEDIPAGVNGFYLPMDGNSPIGKDQSGNGNDWRPVNFGGSVELDNPIVSGARPILNTTQGGTQAGVGVFGSRESVGYAVTVYDDGGGNKYYIDGVKQATLTGLIRGVTYTFDTSDSSVSSHPFRFSDSDGGSEYPHGVAAVTGTATTITIPHNAPDTLYYYCTSHSGMGSSITGITTNTSLADPYAWKCILAVPGVGGDYQDVSPSIACTSNKKSASAGGDPSSDTSFNFYGSSIDLDGNDKVTYTRANAGDFSAQSDFTIEAWFNTDTTSATDAALFSNWDSGNNRSIIFGPNASGNSKFTFIFNTTGSGSWTTVANPGAIAGKWMHVAWVYDHSATRHYAYINGILQGSATGTAYNNSTANFLLGVNKGDGTGYYNGKVQDLRYYHFAKYIASGTTAGEVVFTVPSTSPDILPDTPSGVSGSSKLTKITDGAVAFDGPTDGASVGTGYLTIPSSDSSDFNFGTGDFTWEAFVYGDDWTGGSSNDDQFVIAHAPSDNNNISGLFVDGGQSYYYSNKASSRNIITGPVLGDKRWYHIAASRESGTLRLFVDGVSVGSASYTDSYADAIFTLGRNEDNNKNQFRGFISNFRVIKGTALYTSRFTPPAAPLTNVTNTKLLTCQSPTSNPGTASYDDAVLIMPMNGANNGTTFTDISASSHTPSSVAGNTKTSTTQSKFYGSSGYFDGTGDYLDMGDSNDWIPQLGWTVEMWVYITGGTGTQRSLISQSGSGATNQSFQVLLQTTNKFACSIRNNSGGSWADANSNSAIPENQWVHLAVVVESGGTVKLYVDGTAQTETASFTGTGYDTSEEMWIGGQAHPDYPAYFTGYMNDVAMYQTAKYTSNFTPTTSGLLSSAPNIPAAVSPSTILIKGDAAATNFNPFNTDINTVRGQETGYCTWNPLAVQQSGHGGFRDGNLEIIADTAGSHKATLATFAIPSTGRWYWEVKAYRTGAANNGGGAIGVAERSALAKTAASGTRLGETNSSSWVVSLTDFDARHAGNSDYADYLNGGTVENDTAIIGIAVDMDNDKMWMHYGGVYGNAGGVGNPVTGANPAFSGEFSGLEIFPAAGVTVDSGSGYLKANWGQKPFSFPPPEGYQALNAANTRPETVITRPDHYVDAVAYTSNSGSAYQVSGLNFSPDLILTKNRDNSSGDWNLQDTVCGITSVLTPNYNYVASTQTDNINAVTADGFTVGTGSRFNSGTQKIISWVWKAGGPKFGGHDKEQFWKDGKQYSSAAAVGLTGGTITPTACSIGSRQNFNIIRYTGNATAGATLPHGLGKVPTLIIAKRTGGGVADWLVGHKSLATNWGKVLYLNQGQGEYDQSEPFYDTAPTTTLITMSDSSSNNGDGGRYVMYLWADTPGLFKTGKYVNNAVDDGPYIECGFKPALVLLKCLVSGSTSWRLADIRRDPFNDGVGTNWLKTNSSNGDADERPIDFLSTGFKIRKAAGGDINQNSNAGTINYIFAAWAEAPTIDLYGGGANAR